MQIIAAIVKVVKYFFNKLKTLLMELVTTYSYFV
jgi:phage-related protein